MPRPPKAREAENRRRRRRRRGRGRNFEREGSGVEANGEQPSDEGLETMAAIGGDLIVPIAPENAEEGGFEPSSEDGAEGGRRGRGRWRRRGRGGRSGETGEFNGDWRPSVEGGDESEAGAPARDFRRANSAEPSAPQGESAVFAPLPEWGGEAPQRRRPRLRRIRTPRLRADFASDFAAPPPAIEPASPVAEVTEASACRRFRTRRSSLRSGAVLRLRRALRNCRSLPRQTLTSQSVPVGGPRPRPISRASELRPKEQ